MILARDGVLEFDLPISQMSFRQQVRLCQQEHNLRRVPAQLFEIMK